MEITDICKMIKIEHSVFALPYAYAGAFLACGGMPPLLPLLILTIAMIAVRSFAMAFNRLADLEIDRQNPRTNSRPLVTGKITIRGAIIFTAVMTIVFIASCAALNLLCLCLAVPALLYCAAYSYLKRFTWICHFWLGSTLGLAPLAGFLAINPAAPPVSVLLLFFAVTFWVGAFDIYYSFQDVDYDKKTGLHSVPADFGSATALAIAGFSHTMTVIYLFLTGYAANLGWPWYILCAAIGILLFWEHRLVKPEDLTRINTAFFTLNGIISPMVLAGIIFGLYF